MMSLNLRVLIAASAVLASFFGLAGFTLDQVYRQNAEQALTETLQGHIFTLVASAELDGNGHLRLPEVVPDTRFSSLGSGLFAQVVRNSTNSLQWQSLSMAGMTLPFPSDVGRTERVTRKIIDASGRELFLFSYGVAWDDTPDADMAYTFSVAQDLAGFNSEISAFRQKLWGALGGVALLLLAVQGTILRWGLSPLKHASEELACIEAGSQSSLQGPYPREMQGLTSNINALLVQQHEHLERYRKSLGDLAHSLKTPLAVLQNASANHSADIGLQAVVKEQVERMNQITGYQLQRAATAGWTVLAAPVSVNSVVNKVLNGLKKVYADKGIQFSAELATHTEFHGDEGDLLEVIGNLADNACKWCRHHVRVSAKNVLDAKTGNQALLLQVDDDGAGIAPELVELVKQRGQRADDQVPGHGIGLSIVKDIVTLYGGSLDISASQRGGASVQVSLLSRPVAKNN